MEPKQLKIRTNVPEPLEDEIELQNVINQLKNELVQLVSEKGSFLDHSVIHLSQTLDTYILQMQKRKIHSTSFFSPSLLWQYA
ncbi:aspartyl-phosphate phosphatase Spo0E family protein [Brevibacillus sp. 7WMA2]|uniref:Spo0E like sporulation regulatory protein n=1 Tax=Brevibacillus laterosporus LMG 15441 TaxID=1042163 RepID=A0A075R9Z2_BRELA|nr:MULTISPECIES: aspartyl-phosphate phosphatase Spo0E family protein [Brevibacillus]AIG26355.1 Spo0E like sporulation regulatory protein [Brevibacillus laterosporus LMG 15441]AUM64928.1 aspartyl-phosphate phosphatase Spo0E family protein [Brevibacillus laterosporus]AYK07926.1 aspartyl-phosphate phosphatase Spo0E family protein [Brevibacillus laterosporus]ERM18804.1 sporulation protein Spo0E [Brevibacillus laterosporus PE36]MBA4533144.1 aspartyl-phosphate phosphatase Spo0E family protein [Brevi